MQTALNYKKFLGEAYKIAQQAGNLLLSRFELLHAMEFKGEINPVTSMDRLSEKFIVEGLHKAFPDHGILAEEGTLVEAKGSYRWIVDPLDGTTNYAHGFPMFSVSLALLEEEKPVVGVIAVPRLGEEFVASKGGGAFLNRKPIRVSVQASLSKGFLATGVPYNVRENLDYHLGLMKKFIRRSLAVRRAGSACIDLAYVACGRFDGYWEGGLQPWDTAAGMLVVEEAGGRVTEFDGKPYTLNRSKSLLASNGLLHEEMKEVVQE